MDELIDEALKKILGLKLAEFKKYKPETVADSLAVALVKDALGEGGTRAISVIADRLGGRATPKKAVEGGSELSKQIAEMLRVQSGGR